MHPTQTVRSEDLMNLSPCGQMGPDEKTALRYRDRARQVEHGSSKQLTKIPRLVRLVLRGPIPPWIGELTHLRTLVCAQGTAKLPAGLAKLRHLRFLHLDQSGLKTLDGLEALPALEVITFSDTPIRRDEAAIDAMIAKLPGARRLGYLPGIRIGRRAPAAPRSRAKLVKALRDDTLADETDLRGVNLEGETFEHLWVTHDLAKARLARTVWRHCDFEASLAGADLTGAVFEDCYFSDVRSDLKKVKARGAQWIWCGGELGLEGADLRDAKLYLESDAGLTLSKANAEHAVIVSSFCSEREHRWEARGANLKGAQIELDVTPDRRAEIAKKKASRFQWAQDHVKGAKLDKKTTRLAYAPLTGAPLGKGTIDPKGPSAKVLGSLWANNAGLWALIADAEVATRWRGALDEDDPKNDFERALAKHDAAITIGKHKGFIAQIGDSGGSPIWQIPGGILLADVNVDRKHAKQLDLRVAQWPAPAKKTKLGSVKITSGAIALLLPYEPGDFKQRSEGKVKLPLPNGEYEITTAPLGPTESYEDELGWYGHALRIEKKKK